MLEDSKRGLILVNEMDKSKYMEENNKFKKYVIKYKKWIVLALIVVLLCPFFYYENHHLVVSQYVYSNSKISNEFNDYKIVQVSDLHNAKFGKENGKLINKIKTQKPDMIVITGDIVDSNRSDIKATCDFVKEIANIAPVYYVTGNHEYWLDDDNYNELISGLDGAGAKILNNETVQISRNDESILLIGLDDNYLQGRTLDNLVENEKEDSFKVLLAHEPQYIMKYSKAKVDLVFTGHAHGGQFRLPFIGGVVAPGQGFNPQYTEGIYDEGNTTMVVNRGLGNSVIPVRLFNDPEIITLILKTKEG